MNTAKKIFTEIRCPKLFPNIEMAMPIIADKDQMILRLSMFFIASLLEFLPRYDSMPIPNKADATNRAATGSIACQPRFSKKIQVQ